jgi:hypothetical protein
MNSGRSFVVVILNSVQDLLILKIRLLKKSFLRLLKNAQMQGPRNPEE